MALAAVAFAKATPRRQLMVATSSIGPGATNMVTAAAAAMANRLPLLSSPATPSRAAIPDPVLQQVEHFGAPSTTVNDAFRAVTRYWDRIVTPEQVAQSLPLAVETMLDPADCGPAFIGAAPGRPGRGLGLPGRALRAARARAAPAAARPSASSSAAAAALRTAQRPARSSPAAASTTRSPRTSCGRSPSATACRWSRRWPGRRASPPTIRPGSARSASRAATRPTGSPQRRTSSSRSAPACRTSRPARGPCSASAHGSSRSNAARFDATKHLSLPLVADAREGLAELSAALGDWRADGRLAVASARGEATSFRAFVAERTAPPEARRAPHVCAGRRRDQPPRGRRTTSR